jgi:predicted dehydrogenase
VSKIHLSILFTLQQNTMVMQQIKVGLIGYGISAKAFHAPFFKILPQYKVTAVLERHKQESKSLFPEAVVVTKVEDLLLQDVDLVVITTPNDTHFPYTLKALQAGKHVVVEKPFTITSEDALLLIDAAQQYNRILSVYQNRRYVSDFLTVEDILAKKLLGNVHEFEAHYDRYRPEERPNAWREKPTPGSGILYDLGAHLIDQALYLFGLPTHIYADIKNQRPHAQTTDCFELHLYYGYLKVILKAGMLVRESGPRYMIHGTEGSFIKYGEDSQEPPLRAGIMPVGDDWGKEDDSIYGLLHTDINGTIIKEKYTSMKGDYGRYYTNLYETIINKIPLREQPQHGYNTIKLIELAVKSFTQKAMIECEGLLQVTYPTQQ